MAVDDGKRLAVFASVAEAFSLLWDRRLPYLAMTLLMTLPWVLAMAAGAFDSMAEFTAQSATGTADLSLYPWQPLLWMTLGSFAGMVVFGILWHRFVLLGRDDALRFDAAALAAMTLRSAGYLVVFFVIWVVLFALTFVAAILASVLAGFVVGALYGEEAAFGAGFVLGLAAHIPPVIILARLSLVFPAIAVGERFTLGRSWAATKGSTLKLGGAVLAAAVPMGVLAWAVYFGIFAALGINVMDPLAVPAIYDRWPVHLALGPIWMSAMAMAFTVIAIAFRDLGDGPATAEAPDLSYAH